MYLDNKNIQVFLSTVPLLHLHQRHLYRRVLVAAVVAVVCSRLFGIV